LTLLPIFLEHLQDVAQGLSAELEGAEEDDSDEAGTVAFPQPHALVKLLSRSPCRPQEWWQRWQGGFWQEANRG